MTSKHQFGGKKVQLGDVATYINGYAFKPSDYAEAGKPIIRIQDLTGNAYQTNRYSGELMDRYAVTKGDVLISWSASLGVFEWSGEDAWLNQHIFKVVFDKMPIERRYFIHHACYVIKKSSSLAHGATMRHLTKKVFENLPFFYPNLSDQTRIAKRLDLIQKQISNLNILLKKLDSLIKSRFVEMFENKDFDTISIGKLVQSKMPKAKKTYMEDEVIKYIDISSINNTTNSVIGYTEYLLKEAPSRAQQCIQYGDLLISTVRPNLKNIAINEIDEENLVASSGFCVLRCVDCPREYIKAAVCSDRFTHEMCLLTTGANYPAIRSADILEYRVPAPPIELMNEFAAFVVQVDKLKFDLGICLFILREETFRLSG